MIANVSNALISLIQIVFDLAISVFLLRVLLQLARADFYNPISQLIWKLTQPIIDRLSRVLPRYKRFDIASALVTLLLAVIEAKLIYSFYPHTTPWLEVLEVAGLNVIGLLLDIYIFTLMIQAILSWVGPGVSNPAANVLWSLNEPLLRPVRSVVKPVSGLDLSPVIVMIALFIAKKLIGL